MSSLAETLAPPSATTIRALLHAQGIGPAELSQRDDFHLFSGARVGSIDADGGVEGLALLTHRGRIIGRFRGAPELSDEFPHTDLRGMHVTPGLADMHVHLTLSPERASNEERSADELMRCAAENARVALRAGISMMRDLGSSRSILPTLRSYFAPEYADRPCAVFAGPMITAPGGHGTEPVYRFGAEVRSGAEAAVLIRSLAAEGAQCIKLTTAGFSRRAELSEDDMRCSVETAHQIGLKVAVHALFGRDSNQKAVAIHPDTIEHGCDLDYELAEEMKIHDIALCPTLAISSRFIDCPELVGGRGSSMYQTCLATRDRHYRAFETARAVGVPIVTGTDAGALGMPFDSLIDEMMVMENLGMTRAQVLRSATVESARRLGTGRGEIFGVGEQADFIVTERDPATDLSLLRAPRMIVRAGRPIGRTNE